MIQAGGELQTRARRFVEGIPLGVNLVEIFKGIAAQTGIPLGIMN